MSKVIGDLNGESKKEIAARKNLQKRLRALAGVKDITFADLIGYVESLEVACNYTCDEEYWESVDRFNYL